MSDEAPQGRAAQVVSRYFEADASRDVEATLTLFADDAMVTDEGGAWRGKSEIRDWRRGPASKYEYTTTVARVDRIGDDHYRASGRIDGNFPGATADLKWDFILVEGLIAASRLLPERTAQAPANTRRKLALAQDIVTFSIDN